MRIIQTKTRQKAMKVVQLYLFKGRRCRIVKNKYGYEVRVAAKE